MTTSFLFHLVWRRKQELVGHFMKKNRSLTRDFKEPNLYSKKLINEYSIS